MQPLNELHFIIRRGNRASIQMDPVRLHGGFPGPRGGGRGPGQEIGSIASGPLRFIVKPLTSNAFPGYARNRGSAAENCRDGQKTPNPKACSHSRLAASRGADWGPAGREFRPSGKAQERRSIFWVGGAGGALSLPTRATFPPHHRSHATSFAGCCLRKPPGHPLATTSSPNARQLPPG